MKKYMFMILLTILLTLAACSQTKISNFEECAAAGNPIMESYPRKCSSDGQTYVEEIKREPSGRPEVFCTAEQKAAVACTLEYAPVCGEATIEVQCIKAPCDPIVQMKTYGNACGACASGEIDSYIPGECETDTSETVQVANPASEYCIEQRGRLMIVDEEGGQAGYCNLPDGRTCEEWALYRSEGKDCVEYTGSQTEPSESSCVTDEPCEEPGFEPGLELDPAPDQTFISVTEVEMHNSVDDCYIVFEAKVYDVTAYLSEHPGGSTEISDHCGSLGFEDAFLGEHGTSKIEKMIQETIYIGELS
ncbi:DUF333 domain-containing protein [archaeon]|jgi:putative hemolysin|nr:DUF333 domain-containing protein [archaeon]MBT4021782.1 DUF333 domain-containing protein [archaeon]MBT4271803.1 DUF333 domain-containing protein [archaeon]MBT4460502.1 DUF333 domain-containing protein [archaeon]MBT4858522.1 DUF333 domain-containing protein [archaeon]